MNDALTGPLQCTFEKHITHWHHHQCLHEESKHNRWNGHGKEKNERLRMKTVGTVERMIEDKYADKCSRKKNATTWMIYKKQIQVNILEEV